MLVDYPETATSLGIDKDKRSAQERNSRIARRQDRKRSRNA